MAGTTPFIILSYFCVLFVGSVYGFAVPLRKPFTTSLLAADALVDAYQKKPKKDEAFDVDITITAPEPKVEVTPPEIESKITEEVPTLMGSAQESVESVQNSAQDVVSNNPFEKAPTLMDFIGERARTASVPSGSRGSAEKLFPKLVEKSGSAGGEKAPSFFNYLEKLPEERPNLDLTNSKDKAMLVKQNFDEGLESVKAVIAGANENLSALKEALVQVQESPDSVGQNAVAESGFIGEITDAFATGAALVSENGLAELAKSMHLEEYGPWCLVIATAVWGSSQRNAGRKEALAEAKKEPEEPASDNEVVEDPEKSVASAEKEMAEKERDSLNEQIMALQKSLEESEAAGAEVREKVVELAGLETEVEDLKNELAKTKESSAEVSKLNKEIGDLKNQLADAHTQVVSSQESASSELQQIVEARDGLQLELEKVQAEASEAQQELERAQEALDALLKDCEEVLPETSPAVKEPEVTAPFFAEIAEVVEEVQEETTIIKEYPHPWRSLSMSAIKRKTVKELTAYLEERGINTQGENGKVLRKAALVELVQGL